MESSEVKVVQSCPNLCDPMDCSPPGTSDHGDSLGKDTGVDYHTLLQGIFLNQISLIVGRFFTNWATREAQEYWSGLPVPSSGYLPNPWIEPASPALQVDSLPTELLGKQSPLNLSIRNRTISIKQDFSISYISLLLLLLLLLSRFSRVWLCETPQTAAHQTPPSLGFSRQEYWSGLPFPSPMHESENSKWSCSVVSDS